jgi:hypothetical protein
MLMASASVVLYIVTFRSSDQMRSREDHGVPATEPCPPPLEHIRACVCQQDSYILSLHLQDTCEPSMASPERPLVGASFYAVHVNSALLIRRRAACKHTLLK